MLDPFPPPPAFLSTLTAPLARTLNLTTLPLHIHEVIFAAAIYTFIYTSFSPWISSRLFPRTYASFNARTRLNWDVHVVSLVQSLLVNGLALWVMVTDTQRADMDWKARTWGYTGAGGMVQAFAAGYFVWDLVVSARHVDIFGWGVLAHAASALAVFSLGFVSTLLIPLSPVVSPLVTRHGLHANRIGVLVANSPHAASFCQLLWSNLYPLRTLFAVPQFSLVLRQGQHDRVEGAMVQRHHADWDVLLLSAGVGDMADV
jgi:hypothetical protein